MTETLAEKARRKMKERGLEADPTERLVSRPAPPVRPDVSEFADLVPDVDLGARRQEDVDIDGVIDSISMVDAYVKWCGKSQPKGTKSGESIMVSCPNPDHPDKNPSAWINNNKGVFACGGCGFAGGDKFDVAAWHFGYNVPAYKTDGSFPELRRKMAEELGYTVTRSLTGQTVVSKDESAEPAAAALAPVISIVPDQPVQDLELGIDWRKIVPTDTFLSKWMHVTCGDDLPEEYYFWLGLMAVGFAGADDVVLVDNPLVKPNINVCLYGSTGIGKSRSMRALNEVLKKGLPYDRDDPYSTGIKLVPSPASAEALLDSFSQKLFDPTDPKKIIGYTQVRGLLKVDELSDIMGKASRQGNVLKPLLMSLYDGYGDIDLQGRTAGYVMAKNPFCSVVTTTQPRAIRDLLVQSDADSGFINRWIFASGKPKKLVAIGRAPLDIESTVPLLQGLRTWSSSKRIVLIAPDAKAQWENWFEENIEPMKLAGESTLLTRVDLTLKKLMLLFAMNEKKASVDCDIVDRALLLWPYLRDTYDQLASEIGVGEFEDCRHAVLDFIRTWEAEKGMGPTSRDLSRRMSKRFSRKLIADVMVVLNNFGEIDQKTITNTHGPKTQRFTCVA